MSLRGANIHRSRVHEDMVQRLSGVTSPFFPTIRELLCFAALLGYAEKVRIPLDKSEGVEDISYQQFIDEPESLVYMIALAEEKNPDILRDGQEKNCVQIFEEYANGGLDIIRDVILQGGGDYLDRYIMEFLQREGYLEQHKDEPDPHRTVF